MTKRPSGMTFNTMCGTGKDMDDAKAILSIAPGLNFAVAETPTRVQMDTQEEILGFKWTILEKESGGVTAIRASRKKLEGLLDSIFDEEGNNAF